MLTKEEKALAKERNLTMKDVAVVKELLFSIGWFTTSCLGYMLMNMSFPDETKMKEWDGELKKREERLNKLIDDAEAHREKQKLLS